MWDILFIKISMYIRMGLGFWRKSKHLKEFLGEEWDGLLKRFVKKIGIILNIIYLEWLRDNL
jgi:hypothetical protein